ncbi:hypothetical protein [Haloferula sp.]|uniref:hypothetical protein n=1 Tax=Haloferula sp. TaxID=2497595 RepID=UPI003C742C1D
MAVVLVFIVGQCPVFAAGLIVAASAGSDHRVLCGFDSHEITVVLAHHPRGIPHRHTLAERLFLSSAEDDDHPDHQFHFVREAAMTAVEDSSLPLPTAMPVSIFFADEHWDSCFIESCVSVLAPHPPPSLGTSSPNALLLCVVMRR